ncbi:hypothetical protein Anapl_14448 [Anas platyrhynchos]|uniref:Uncharacterized protein n=1 Tax=Anas platyrhynchos TaxID=8839 RepID=R0JWX4_ANAPL|nr:hypothetical protein Anapl_14448 [Anas platyrhynchos]
MLVMLWMEPVSKGNTFIVIDQLLDQTGGSHSLQQWSKQPPPPPVVLKRHAALEAVREGGNWQPALSAIGTAAWYNPSPAIFCSQLQLGPIHGCEKDQSERQGCLLSYFIIFFAQNSANQGRNRNLALPDTEFLTSVGDVKEQLPCAKTQILCLTGLPVSNCNKYLSLQEAWQTLHGGQPLISGAKLCYFVVQASEDLSTCLLTVLTVNQKPGPADMDQGIDSKATGISLCSVSHLSCFTLRQSPCFGKVDGGMSSTSVGSTEGQVTENVIVTAGDLSFSEVMENTLGALTAHGEAKFYPAWFYTETIIQSSMPLLLQGMELLKVTEWGGISLQAAMHWTCCSATGVAVWLQKVGTGRIPLFNLEDLAICVRCPPACPALGWAQCAQGQLRAGPQILHPSSMIRLPPLPAEAGKLLLWQLRASCLVSALNHTVGCGGLGNQTYVSDTKGVNKPHSQQLSSWACKQGKATVFYLQKINEHKKDELHVILVIMLQVQPPELFPAGRWLASGCTFPAAAHGHTEEPGKAATSAELSFGTLELEKCPTDILESTRFEPNKTSGYHSHRPESHREQAVLPDLNSSLASIMQCQHVSRHAVNKLVAKILQIMTEGEGTTTKKHFSFISKTLPPPRGSGSRAAALSAKICKIRAKFERLRNIAGRFRVNRCRQRHLLHTDTNPLCRPDTQSWHIPVCHQTCHTVLDVVSQLCSSLGCNEKE